MQTKQSHLATADSIAKTKNLNKLSANANAVTWFEIPVTDMKRAKQFYETVLDVQLVSQKGIGAEGELELFPRGGDGPMGRSDMVSGALVKKEGLRPSADGIVIYLNANPSIDKATDRVKTAGGKLTLQKTKNPAGYVAVMIDSEGNKIGLFSGE
jgi:predicted enzyme related to lactoylglutathione lyase